MKSLFFAILFTSFAVSAQMIPGNVLNALGRYESSSIQNSDYYGADELATFEVSITPSLQAIVYFPEWDLEIELGNNLSFGQSDINECEDPGCSGLAELEGKISFKSVNGVETPFAKVTMYFYADISEDIDCDEVDCDNLSHDDTWKEWEETYEFEFMGTFPDQLPAFKPVTTTTELATNLEDCNKLVLKKFVRCARAQQYEFVKEFNEENLSKLKKHLGVYYSQQIGKETLLALVESHYNNQLLQAKIFATQGQNSNELEQAHKNINQLMRFLASIDNDSILTNITNRTTYHYEGTMSFFIVSKATNQVILLSVPL